MFRNAFCGPLVSDSTTSICCGFVVQQAVRQIHNKSKANSKSTTSCRTNSKSYNKLDNLSHSKSTTQINSKLHATISKSYSKSHNLLYSKSTTSRSNGVRHLVRFRGTVAPGGDEKLFDELQAACSLYRRTGGLRDDHQ